MDTATRHVPTSRAAPDHPQGEVLRQAHGIELIGEFEGSGFKNPPLLARRADGQVVQLTRLLYEVAAAADGRRDTQSVADVVGSRCGRAVNATDVAFLAERKLRPLGVLALPDGTTPVLKKRPPVMALRHRKPLLSERAVNSAASTFTWLHVPFVQAALLVTLAAFDAWLFGVHGIAGALRSALYDPGLLLAVLASVVVATAFHEFGHASACRYAGARPGAMGVGLYLVWPVFYCDVTDAYRLNRAGRLRTDLGGIYFNALFALLAGGVFLYTGQQVALLAAFVQHLLILQQLIPLMRFDGYYVVTDLTGVPDILSRIKPIFRSLIRGREHEPQVAELKPWVRWVVTIYLGALVPTLLLLFAWMLIATPRMVATLYRAFAMQLNGIDQAGPAEMAADAVRTLMLVLQLGAMALSLSLVGRMAGRALLRWSRGSVPRTAALALGTAALVGAAAFIWWPEGDYRPIQPDERGTVQDGLNSLANLAGRTGLIAGNHSARTGGDTSGTVSGRSGAPGEHLGNGHQRNERRIADPRERHERGCRRRRRRYDAGARDDDHNGRQYHRDHHKHRHHDDQHDADDRCRFYDHSPDKWHGNDDQLADHRRHGHYRPHDDNRPRHGHHNHRPEHGHHIRLDDNFHHPGRHRNEHVAADNHEHHGHEYHRAAPDYHRYNGD
ncbi:MAG TPA: hypothetical protein VFH80_25595 [Solirubrobacteraceae bacterium]|nr:hypothetical protein [Solirubrobacteraceae bacterium]